MNIKTNTFIRGVYVFLKSYLLNSKKQFGYCGEKVLITPPVYVDTPKNVFLHGNTELGLYAHISCPNARFIVHKNCSIAEHLTVHTGNHTYIVGKFITDITEDNKPDGFDKDVVIEAGCWIGTRAIILKGVTIGRGSVIGAGAIVTKDVPPYTVYVGVPSVKCMSRFSESQILQHEKMLEDRGIVIR